MGILSKKSTLADEILEHICEKVAEGFTIRDISRELQLPHTTIWNALNHPDRVECYARAKEQRADRLAEQIQELSDTELPTLADGRIDGARVQQLRLQVDVRKWNASKLYPKRYGDKIDVEHTGNVTLTVDTGVPLRTITQEPPALIAEVSPGTHDPTHIEDTPA